MPACRTWWLF
jgi:hypothetical protein